MTDTTEPKLKILYVDDEIEALNMIAIDLEDDFEVIVASNVDDARKAFDEHKIEAAVGDYHMPGGNGMTLINHLTATLSVERIFLLTADKSLESLSMVVTFLTKPIDSRDLTRYIMNALKDIA